MKIPVPEVINPPSVKRKRSSLHGYGMFTLESITRNKRIIEYAGEKIPISESEEREERYLNKGNIWCFRINQRWSRDANIGENDARFINHFCAPNCYSTIIGHTILICAGQNISAGEELTYNYYTEGEAEIPCRCCPGCGNMP